MLNAIVPYRAWTDFTPTVPQFYWDVYSQEQRIKHICMELHKLVEYSNTLCLDLNLTHEAINELETEFEKFKESGFLDYYEEQINAWIQTNMESIISQAIKMVWFGLTEDGYFCAHVPASWSGILFDTIMDYSSENYGCLVLRY